MRKKLLLAGLFCTFISAFCFAQDISVTGQVTDQNGNALSGATISVKGSKTATSSDERGTFSISVARGARLIISSVGFTTKEIDVTGNSVSIILNSQARDLNEVVVT